MDAFSTAVIAWVQDPILDPKPKESSMKVMLIEPILNRYVAQTERRPERLAAERGRSVATETAGGDLGLLQ